MPLIVALAGIVVASIVGALWFRASRRKTRAVPLIAPDLADRVVVAARAFSDVPTLWNPSAQPSAPDGAATIEIALRAGDSTKAITAAETTLAAAPDKHQSRVWLAWALVASGQPAVARATIADAPRDPLSLYVAARAEHLAFEHAAGATGAWPPLITAADLAIVTLARGRGGAAWLASSGNTTLSAAEVGSALAEHRTITAQCLETTLAALEAAPTFAEAAYFAARLAIKLGVVTAGTALLVAVEPHLSGRDEAAALVRDKKDLADSADAIAAALRPAPTPTAKRSRSLKVLP